MAVNRPFVEGPDFVIAVREADELVSHLENNNWDFDAVPEVFARTAAADVVAKEVVHIHDGQKMTRFGRLVMGGVGKAFNLMGPIPSDSRFMVTNNSVLNQVKEQIGGPRVEDLDEYQAIKGNFAEIQRVDFFNYGAFYSLRDMVFWLLVHDAGCFPSTLETMVRNFAAGNIIQNHMYTPLEPSWQRDRPVLMAPETSLMVQFPSNVVEWMDKPMFGGLAEDTVHVEYLLTPEPSEVSHPYLPLIEETVAYLGDQQYFVRAFAGVSPKDALRGPGVPPEQAGES